MVVWKKKPRKYNLDVHQYDNILIFYGMLILWHTMQLLK